MAINSLEELKSYCLRQLGYPVITVELSDDQQNDCIDDCLQMFGKYHYDGFTNGYVNLPVQKGVMSYDLSEITSSQTEGLSGEIIAVTKIVRNLQLSAAQGEPSFDLRWDIMQEKRWVNDYDTTGYFLMMNKLSVIDSILRSSTLFQFNQSTHIITFDPAPEKDGVMCLECYVANDPYEYADIYNNDWVKKYATALMMYQWGKNLTKHTGVPLPGGATLNGEAIRSEGKDAIKELEDELAGKFSLPPMFQRG